MTRLWARVLGDFKRHKVSWGLAALEVAAVLAVIVWQRHTFADWIGRLFH